MKSFPVMHRNNARVKEILVNAFTVKIFTKFARYKPNYNNTEYAI